MIRGVRIDLTEDEYQHANWLAEKRHRSSQRRRSQGAHGGPTSGRQSLRVHQLGAYGECAYAIWAARLLPEHVDVFCVPDFDPDIAVRARSVWYYELLRRFNEPADWRYVLVTVTHATGERPTCWLRGWLWGYEMEREEWVQEHGGREPAWFAPHKALHQIDELDQLS